MIDGIFWYLWSVSLVLCFIFLSNFLVSFYYSSISKGRLYQRFKEDPKRFLLRSFLVSLVFSLLFNIPDLIKLFLAVIVSSSSSSIINDVIISIVIQFLLILILGSLLAWLSYGFGISLGYKIFRR